MTNDSIGAESPILLLHDCSVMDDSIVERLRATVQVSLEWADQMLDVLISLDDDLKAFDVKVKQQMHSLNLPKRLAPDEMGETGNRIPGLEEVVQQMEQSVGHLRNAVRDVMMSMQNQDVIGQAVERAASVLEKRVAAIERVVVGVDFSHLHTTNEISEIHRVYRADDNLHRDAGLATEEYKEEYKAIG